ncbi:MAG: hydroxymethylglutaryl-CoA reductase, degradative [Flavobacteriales bacterium]|nr:hydroxymethylglutaryl-CoA reductase, degradative [Flavobacteriales bacterium]MCX7769128.1 hydroxymethylglutaryl-CoA reductase, degradative [Flavobacteriales bacterium]MDW8410170.1 hydroxymethylglutaryl-CoA reductase, degradative [Flavobacteriales bacterium]
MNTTSGFEGFSKLSKEEKLRRVCQYFTDPDQAEKEFRSFWHRDSAVQKQLDEFSENTITNFYFPYGVVPNVLINGKSYIVPMVIEESSVVAAAAKSAKFWSTRGGFKTRVLGMEKIGQVHFIWKGEKQKLYNHFAEIKKQFLVGTRHITSNMEKRGGGILSIELVDMTHHEPGYYQVKATFDTCDSMGANFINSCLEEFALILKDYVAEAEGFEPHERDLTVIMSILSNYTPHCKVECVVECPIEDLGSFDGGLSAQEFARKFALAVKVAQVDPHRATTHNKGIYNGIDAVVLATGNDFRAVEACGHTYAARDGQYRSLSRIESTDTMFRYVLEVPLALGVVGGLTRLHPMARRSLELLGHPTAAELMQVAVAIGMANNFGALKSLVTTGIQKGHMKMHLLNILNHFEATEEEKSLAIEYFKHNKVSFYAVRSFLLALREGLIPGIPTPKPVTGKVELS